jgi:hypothetical protein
MDSNKGKPNGKRKRNDNTRTVADSTSTTEIDEPEETKSKTETPHHRDRCGPWSPELTEEVWARLKEDEKAQQTIWDVLTALGTQRGFYDLSPLDWYKHRREDILALKMQKCNYILLTFHDIKNGSGWEYGKRADDYFWLAAIDSYWVYCCRTPFVFEEGLLCTPKVGRGHLFRKDVQQLADTRRLEFDGSLTQNGTTRDVHYFVSPQELEGCFAPGYKEELIHVIRIDSLVGLVLEYIC